MTDQNKNIIKHELNEKILRILPRENNDLLILLQSKILCLKSPNYKFENALNIIINDIMFYEMSLWKNNHIIIISLFDLYLVHLSNDNKTYNIIKKSNLYNNINTKFKRFIQVVPLNKFPNYSQFILNSFGKFFIYNQLYDNSFQSKLTFKNLKCFQSFIQIRKNEIVCNSETEKKVYFIDIKKGNYLAKINNIYTYILDRDIFCFINENILGMAGDLRNGIYIFDINKREFIYQYKEDWRGYNCLLSLGKNKFLGESYDGRSYGESDDEEEELYCTKFFEFNEKDNKLKLYKTSDSRITELKRSNFIKFNNVEKIAYIEMKNVYIEDLTYLNN